MRQPKIGDDWPEFGDEQLLDIRLADLPLRIEGTLAGRIDQLRGELDARGLRLPIHFYLADEWFTPDGATSIAIPFYLAHPRLEKLEEAQMFEVEGGEHEWGMRILRHEAGHALDNAFRLRLKRQRREIFGNPSTPYPEFYTPRPHSKSFVLHLDSWYAQSHPDEDFAETFAVWLTPNSEWRTRYAGWPALKKLEYMDSLMQVVARRTSRASTIRSKSTRCRSCARRCGSITGPNANTTAWTIPTSTIAISAGSSPTPRNSPRNLTAAQFISRIRRPVRRVVANWTGIFQYTIDQVLEDMIARCRELRLRLAVPEDVARQEFTVLLTVQAMNYLHSGGHRLFL